MTTIQKICIHNFGGLKDNPLASTINLTESHINNAHFSRWPELPSELNGSYIGYNEIIYPNGFRKQYRYLGEETAAVKGSNFDTYSICLAGNYTKGVDTPTKEQVESLSNTLKGLVKNSPESVGIKVKKGTIYSFDISRIYPHRLLAPKGYTDCYGNALPDDWARSLAMPTAVIQPDTTSKAALGIIDEIILLLSKLRQLFSREVKLGGEDRDDVDVL